MKKKLIVLMLALVMIFSLMACNQANGPTDPTDSSNTADPSNGSGNTTGSANGDPTEISVGVYQLTNSLEPLTEDLVSCNSIVYHVYDRLLKFDSNNEWLPAIATSWERVDDATWSFEINLDYKFQNGDQLTMDDIVFSIMRLKDVPKQLDIGNLIKSVTYEGNTLTFEGVNSDASIATKALSTAVIINKAYVESVGDDALFKAPIGTGPYKVTEFTPGSTCTIETWGDYPFEKPQIDKINFSLISDTTARYIALETGSLQFVNNLTPFELKMAEENNDLITMSGDARLVACLVMTCDKPPFDNANVRRAMAHAFDREGFCSLLGGRVPMPATMFIGYDLMNISSEIPEFDLEKAKALLEAEGYNESNPLQFTLTVNTASDPGLEMFQSALKTIGVEMRIDIVEFSVWLAREMEGDFDMGFTPQANKGNHPLSDLDRYDANMIGTRDVSRYSNNRAQELIDTMRFTYDQQALKEMADELSDIIAREAPMIGVNMMQALCAMDKNLSGVIIDNRVLNFREATYTG